MSASQVWKSQKANCPSHSQHIHAAMMVLMLLSQYPTFHQSRKERVKKFLFATDGKV